MIPLGLALTAVLGWLCLPRRVVRSPLAGLAFGFGLGSFALSVEMFLLATVGAGWNAWVLLLPLVALAAWKFIREKPSLEINFHWADGVALAATLAALWVWLPGERLMPLTSQSWDAWAIWLFKSKAFFVDGDVSTYLSRSSEFTGQPGYPLLTPLYGTFLYLLHGGIDDYAVKLITPAFFLAMLGAAHSLIARLASRPTAGLLTAMLALTPQLGRGSFAQAGYADVPLAFYTLCAAGFLTLWLREHHPALLAAASVSAAAAAWTKNEGQLFLAVFGLIAAAGLVLSKAKPKHWAIAFAPAAVLLGLWSVVRSSAAVEAAGFAPGVDFEVALFARAAEYLAQRAFAVSEFGLTFLLLPAAAAALLWRRRDWRSWPAVLLVAAQLSGALLAYATGRNEIEWWLGTSADRLLLQVVPLVLLAAGIAAGACEDKPSSVASAPVSST